jgi:hypothetical protein
MKALKSDLAKSILATPEGSKAVRDWLTGKLPIAAFWYVGKEYLLMFVGKAETK